MRQMELVDQSLEASRFLDRIQVFALDVFDQRLRRGRRVRHIADQRRDLGEAGHLRRAPSALAGNDLVLAIASGDADQHRLHQALRLDRARELVERLGVHPRSRLVAPPFQRVDPQHLQLVAGLGFVTARQERIEAASKPSHLYLCHLL